MIVDLQLNQGSAPWSVLRDAALAAEDAGYGTLWNLDHFSGHMFGVDSMLECFSSLSAWAAVTSTIGLGTLVANVNNRHPGLLANAVSTVQEVSGGRMILGVGSGASPTGPYSHEHAALGIDLLPTMAQRHERLVEVVEQMRRIWADDRHDSFVGFPRPKSTPRVIAGVNSEGLATLAGARLDGVNVRFNHPERARLLAAATAAHRDRVDRDASVWDESVWDVSVWAMFEPSLADPNHPFHAELAAEGVTRLILLVRGAPDVEAIAATARYFA